MRAGIRLLTAIALIAMSGLSVAQGWRIVHFSLATMNINSSEKRAEITNAWRAVPGLASIALQADLTDEINPSDMMVAYRRRAVLSELLSIRPLSSMDWFSLSGMQLVTDQPMEDVLASLKLSMMTGPNEAYVMTKRGVFAVSLWEICRQISRAVWPMIWVRHCFPVVQRKERARQIAGRSFRKTRARAQGDTKGASRHRAFAERD